MKDSVRDPLVKAVEVVLEEAESGRSGGSKDRRVVRPFLLVDLSEALSYARKSRGRGKATEAVENRVEETLQTETSDRDQQSDSSSGGSGRSTLSKLFLVGVVAGLGYALRKRSGSVGKTVGRVTDRARSAADETERRSGEMAGQTEAVTEKAADRIEETGETVADQAADRVRESGEMAADSVQETGETAADEMETAAEKTEETEEKAGSGDEDEESEE